MAQWRPQSRRVAFPAVEPCQRMPTPRPPCGSDWLHEIKHDGFQLIAKTDGARVGLLTRNANDWTERYPLVAEVVASLRFTSCILDPEIAAYQPEGAAFFDLLRFGRKIKPDAVFHCFGLNQLDGDNLQREPIGMRKQRLRRAVHH